MERDPPKKKKKYVPVNKPQNNQQASILNEQNQMKSINTNEDKALERGRFQYTFEQIFNHLLARLLPNSNFTIKLSQKLIFGEEKALDKFIAKLDDNIKYTAGFVLELKQNVSKEDIDYSMEECFRGKTFNHRLIDMSVNNFFEGTKYQRQYDAFLLQFKDQQKERLYVRLNKEYMIEFLQKVEKKADLVQKQQEVPIRKRGNRTVFKAEVDSVELDSDVLDLNDMYKFFNKSQKLDRSDLVVTKNRNKYDQIVSYKIALMSYDAEKQRKMEGFSYYFRHQNFVLLPLKQCKHKDEIIEQYGKIDEPHIKTKVLRGYKSSKWQDKSLLYKIRTGSITNKRTNYTNQYFEAIHLRGLLPTIQEYIKRLEDEINEVPLDDIQEQIFVEFDDKIKDYIRNSKEVEVFIEKFIKQYMNQYKNICVVQKIKFPLRGVKLDLRIKNNEEEQFDHIRQSIEKVMPKYIAQQKVNVDFAIDQEFLSKLQKEGIMIVDKKQKEFVYLTSTEELEKCVQIVQKALQEFQSIGEQTLEVFGLTKKQKYLQLIQNIKKESQEYLQILVAEPFTTDKVHFKFTFYGPRKKNDKFVEQIKKRIDKMESQLGQHSEFIDERVGKLIVEDNQIQQEIQKQCSISMVVGTCTIEARLQICSKKKSQVFIIKANNLEKIPLGSFIFFECKVIIQELKEKYLQKFKLVIKRYKQDKWLDQHEKTRNYHFLYKYNSFTQQILNQAVTRSTKIDQPIPLALLMPKMNKRDWLNKIFDILSHDQDLSQVAFKIYVIETDQDEQIQKIVNIPEYSPFTADNEQMLVEWFCQKTPYTKEANAKINDAIANHQNQLILGKDDIESTKNTHICDIKRRIICYTAGGTYQETPFFFDNASIIFTHKGRQLTFPQSEYNKVLYHSTVSLQNRFYLNMPFYLIDLTKNTQINLFTNFQRKLQKKQTKITHQQGFKGEIKAFYGEKMTQLIYSFKEAESKHLQTAVHKMKEYINNHWNKQVLLIKDINEISEVRFRDLLKERITARAQQHGLKYEFDPLLKSITVESFEIKDIQKFKNVMESEVEYLVNLSKKNSALKGSDFKYPQFWQPQAKEIETFEVPANSPQYTQVAQLFAARPIYSITRIQNKIIYRRYLDELQHLSHMNGSEPKQMKLFHGTGKTSPEVIWTDQQDGFNINYSGQNNLLGRGIYFAQRAEYSTGYASTQGIINNKQTYGMFLCMVIVGDSQQMKMSQSNKNVIDTNFKPNGMRFQSMKGVHYISDIYVVFKNRRAYPLYFIRFN